MTTKAKFFKAAEAAGCDVEYLKDHDTVWCVLWAPEGKAFISSGCSCDASFNSLTTPDGSNINWPIAYSALLQVIAEGFQAAEEVTT